MKRFFVLLLLFSFPPFLRAEWNINPFENKVFIENKGQFDHLAGEQPVLFGVQNMGYRIYFTSEGFLLELQTSYTDNETKKAKELERKNLKPGEKSDKLKAEIKKTTIYYKWLNTSAQTRIVPSSPVSCLYHFADPADHQQSVNYCRGFEKITYENIYEGIDLEFVFHPEQGIKYNFILQPGADVTAIQLKYETEENVSLENGRIRISSISGYITEEAPVVHYTSTGLNIPASYQLEEKVLGYSLGLYDSSEEIVIDPWVIIPAMPTNNKAYEVQKDAAGNVYVYGGTTPFVLNKYNSSGTALWSLSLSLTSPLWTGDLLVDPSGFCYLTDAGVGPGNNITKVDNATGTTVWAVYTAGGEFFRLTHNCDLSKVYTAGGPALAYMKEINPITGAATTSLFMAGNAEIKSIARAPNGNYYFVTNSNNRLYAANSAFTVLWSLPNGHTYSYYTPVYLPQNGGSNYIAVNRKFIFTFDGTLILKRDICNGALLGSTNVPGGIFEMNGGLMLDSCGNLYAGSQNAIYKYDENLNILSSSPTSAAVYDISTGIAPGEILACGDGFVTAVNMSVCLPIPFPPACPAALTASITTTIPTCGSACTGSATVTPTGTGPFEYFWTPGGQTTQTITGLCAGTYSVIVTDRYVKMCSPVSVTINTNPVPTLSLSSQNNVLCNGGNSGSASASASGGTSPYTYLWSNSQTTATATGLTAGTYTATVTDASGCTATVTVTITQPAALSSSTGSVNATCGSNNGSATVTASGGTSPYTYLWSNSQTNASATGLSAATYTVTITDANGCTQTATAVVGNSNGPVASVTGSTNVLCNGGSNGNATASASGGTAPYTYLWSNSQTNASATGLTAGTYTVTVTDANGCTSTQTVTITQPSALSASTTNTSATCGSNNGSATVTASGGTSPYTYLWSNSQTNANATGLSAATYTVTITDANGCTQTAIAVVGSISGPVADAGSNVTIISGNSTPLSASGGNTYSWSPASGLSCSTCPNPTASPTSTTVYYVVVTDANGCTDSDSVTVYVETPCDLSSLDDALPNAFSPNNDGYNDVYCVPSNLCFRSFEMKVYDRWGENVFSSNGTSICWDGSFKGKELNTAVFVYTFEAILMNGESFSQKGNISLIR